MISNYNLCEGMHPVQALAPITPSTTTPAYVSLKNYNRCSIVISGVNTASGVTGSAITLTQATTVTNTSGKALAFDTVWANTDTAASDTMVKTAVASNTFTTTTTGSKKFLYVIDVVAPMLDVSSLFDCLRVNTADAVNTTLNITYILRDNRYSAVTPPTATAN